MSELDYNAADFQLWVIVEIVHREFPEVSFGEKLKIIALLYK